ncbi:MAG: hypothetical protein KAY37_14275 [Phycisphaerae bacterium]|nr:hypothetical protein [Phycisphaerae bacterium]
MKRGTSLPASRRLVLGLGITLVLALYIAGSPSLDAPWIQGDEFIFIVDNPAVNPAADPDHAEAELGTRLLGILMSVHEDLYQPIPLLTYALEWELTSGRAHSFRRTDLLLHALNALLLWWVLATVLRQEQWARSVRVSVVAWALALLWALHPMLVTTYAADMGRTHLLSATFALLALGLYWRGLVLRDTDTTQRATDFGPRGTAPAEARGSSETAPAEARGPSEGVLLGALRKELYFGGAVAALLLAMLCKPVVGWVLLALILEAARRGWRRALTSYRLYVIALICLGFAVFTMQTSRESGILEDVSQGLFGDPAARGALAVWIYFRNLVTPLWLAFWYLPDPRTGWSCPLVWIGVGLAAAGAWHAVRSWRRPETRAITIGWAWCWGLLLPVIGLVGAREVAAVDRYFYQPLMGIMLIVGVLACRVLARFKPAASARIILSVAGVLALAMLAWDLPQCKIARSNIRRARRLVELNQGDPRALEALAAAYDFARNHPLPRDDQPVLAPGMTQLPHFNELFKETLTRAATADNLVHYFPGPEDRTPFHRRLSHRFLSAGSPEEALAQARVAFELQPENFITWIRLAQAYRRLENYAQAAHAYEQCERYLPADPLTRLIHFADFGYMLMFNLDSDAEACPRLAAALELRKPARLTDPRTWRLAKQRAKFGYAHCQIRSGEGERGLALICEVLQADPANPRAAMHIAGDFPPQLRAKARALLDDFLAGYPDSPHRSLAQGLRDELSDHETAPE